MADVTVLVDDAVCGRLPPVCAQTGSRSDSALEVDVPLAVAPPIKTHWLLLLVIMGPPGWFLWAVLRRMAASSARRSERLHIKVPWSRYATVRHDGLRANRALAWITAGAATGAALIVVFAPIGEEPGLAMDRPAARVIAATLVAVIAGATAAALTAGRRITQASIAVTVDPSHRWVTLSGVAPRFSEAVRTPQRRAESPVC